MSWERGRCPRVGLQPAPGRLGYSVPRHDDRGGRCIPGLGQAKAGNARSDRVLRKPGLKLSLEDEILPWVRAAVERRQASQQLKANRTNRRYCSSNAATALW